MQEVLENPVGAGLLIPGFNKNNPLRQEHC